MKVEDLRHQTERVHNDWLAAVEVRRESAPESAEWVEADALAKHSRVEYERLLEDWERCSGDVDPAP